MKKLSIILASVLVFGVSISAVAMVHPDNTQSSAKHDIKVGIPSYSLVGVSSTSGIELKPGVSTVAGEGLNFSASSASDESVWLNYSSILSGETSNSISVSMTGDNLPSGVSIELIASADAGKGKGETGTAKQTKITLNGQDQDIVTGIGNCYTGTGSGSGHKLTYSLKMSDEGVNYKKLTSGSFTTTVTYTITDN